MNPRSTSTTPFAVRNGVTTSYPPVAPIAHDELLVCIEGAPRLDSLPLISVGDRVGEDLLVRPDWALFIGDRCGVAFLTLSQPVELLAHVDEDNPEHGDEDDQQCPAKPEAAHAARLVGCLVVHQSLVAVAAAARVPHRARRRSRQGKW